MSGPSLNKLNAHRSIHDGVVTEGRDLLELLLKVRREKRADHEKHALMTAEALIEHWDTRLIAHADSEEEGFYEKKLADHPDLNEALTKLKRDHDLFRMLNKEIKDLISNDGVTEEVIDRFKTIYILARIHNRDEEGYLLEDHG